MSDEIHTLDTLIETQDIKQITRGELVFNETSPVKSIESTNDSVTAVYTSSQGEIKGEITCQGANDTCQFDQGNNGNFAEKHHQETCQGSKKNCRKVKRAARMKEPRQIDLAEQNGSKCTQLNDSTRAKSLASKEAPSSPSSSTFSSVHPCDVVENQCYSGNKYKGIRFSPQPKFNGPNTCYKAQGNLLIGLPLSKLIIVQVAKLPFGRW